MHLVVQPLWLGVFTGEEPAAIHHARQLPTTLKQDCAHLAVCPPKAAMSRTILWMAVPLNVSLAPSVPGEQGGRLGKARAARWAAQLAQQLGLLTGHQAEKRRDQRKRY